MNVCVCCVLTFLMILSLPKNIYLKQNIFRMVYHLTGLIKTKEVSKKFVALHSKWNY